LAEWHEGAWRLAFRLGAVRFTSFVEADVTALLTVRNDAGVRPFMPTPVPVAPEEHLAWVRANLLTITAATPLLVLGRHGGKPVGFGVVKPTREHAVLELGVMVVENWQRGLLPARLALALVVIAKELLGARELLTHVRPAHLQAMRFNRAWGLEEVPSSKPGEMCLQGRCDAVLSTTMGRRSTRDLVLHVIGSQAR